MEHNTHMEPPSSPNVLVLKSLTYLPRLRTLGDHPHQMTHRQAFFFSFLNLMSGGTQRGKHWQALCSSVRLTFGKVWPWWKSSSSGWMTKFFLGKVTFCGKFHFLIIPCVSSLLVKSPEKITPSFYFSGLLCFSENRC